MWNLSFSFLMTWNPSRQGYFVTHLCWINPRYTTLSAKTMNKLSEYPNNRFRSINQIIHGREGCFERETWVCGLEATYMVFSHYPKKRFNYR